jgi:histidinol-phosphatase
VLGEETGAHEGTTTTRWIVDPIDGTRGFARGETFWGPLVGLEHEGEVVAGAMALPVASEVYFAARGRGAWLSVSGAAPERLRVSGISRWEDATFSLGEPRVLLAPPFLEPVSQLATTCARTRCHGDLAGFAMVLTGRAEAWVEAGVQIWDLAPMKILLEEAGGRFTDLAGRLTIASGNCIASNGALHESMVEALRRTATG